MAQQKFRKTALVLALLILGQAICPSIVLALGSGPTQPEFQGFQQVGTSDMVNLFTGDFSYNLPLMEIGGYPINMVYNANPRMDDEASWVGLGWTLNPGVINRQMRGLPDDFRGDELTKSFNIQDDVTVSGTIGFSTELLGKKLEGKTKDSMDSLSIALNYSLGISRNTYRGFQMELAFRPEIALAKGIANFTAGLGIAYTPAADLTINPNIGLGVKIAEKISIQNSIGAGYNSRRGLKALTYQAGTNNFGLYSASTSQFDYIPTSSLPLENTSFMYHATGGAAFWAIHPNLEVDGSYAKQALAKNMENQPAYGYLYLDEATNEKDILDYNSELKGAVKANIPYVPAAYGTPDYFSISGQGIGGQFKAMRNDVGIFRPSLEATTNVTNSLGVEFGSGSFAHFGADITNTKATNTKKEWERRENKMRASFQFTNSNNAYESVYFKSMGEFTPLLESGIYNKSNGIAPIRVNNESNKSTLHAGNDLYTQAGETATAMSFMPSGKINNEQRVIRNRVITYKTNQELPKQPREEIYHFPQDTDCSHDIIRRVSSSINSIGCNCGVGLIKPLDRSQFPAHHIGEFSILEPNGSRYIYGLPVYNQTQKEVTFSIDAEIKETDAGDKPDTTDFLPGTHNVDSPSYGLVKYNPGTDNTPKNEKGAEHYYDATEIPKYAATYLLTKVLTSEFVTPNALTAQNEILTGDYISFQYSKHNPSFKWRIPVNKNRAKYHQGLKADIQDDKASYVYGEKELWYVYSIESASEILRFYTSPRKDGLGVKGENGGIDENMTLLKLDSIALFNKQDLFNNTTAAIPIKKAHFRYNYSLCKNVPNQSIDKGGKLTLEKVFFTYGNSKSGALNPYKFHYGEKINNEGNALNNYNYNIGHYDRWGFFQKNPKAYPPNHEYPFVLQDKDALDASAWNLTSIELPSGGKMEVEYEPDDYAWVQDRRAGQMMPILGFSDAMGVNASTELYINRKENRKFIRVALPNNTITDLAEIEERYLEGIEQVYFDCLVQLDKDKTDTQERVSGYFTIDKETDLELKGTTELRIPVKYLTARNKHEVHPITFAALQKLRLELPHLIFPGYREDNFGKAFIKSIVGLLKKVGNFFKSYEKNAMKRGFGKKVITANNASWLRLCSPSFKKIGGGSRVKQLTVSDEWNFSKGHKPAKYGQKYFYTTTKTINGIKRDISSGVAAYEPGIGGEENLLKEPLPYEEKIFLAPKNLYYEETPIGEALYPGPMVGYSEVKVKDIANDTPKLLRNQSGHTVHHFYTAKDFPVQVKKTEMKAHRVQSNLLGKALKLDILDGRSISQGYTIELNDMHGKSKSQSIFDKDSTLLSATHYHYKLAKNGTEKSLSNEVDVIHPNNTITKAELGVEIETWTEMLEENNEVGTKGLATNQEVFPIPFPPFVFNLPPILPIFRNSNTQFRSASITKCINRYGILDSVQVMENGSTITTHNELYDSNTGNVVLTRTVNEFDDPIYDFKYPAHWAYEGMGQAYDRAGAIFRDVRVENGVLVLPSNLASSFKAGDEVIVQDNNEESFLLTARVGKVDNQLVLIFEAGVLHSTITSATIKIIRPSTRNLLDRFVGQVTTLASPINRNNQLEIKKASQVVNAAATTFTQEGKQLCRRDSSTSLGTPLLNRGDQIDPYFYGIQGNWRPFENWVYFTDRSTETIGNTDASAIRKAGTATSFSSFWSFDDGWEKVDFPQHPWTRSNTVSMYDYKGNELENRDVLGIYSAAYFGFENSIPIAIANNAQYQEIFFESFEDEGYTPNCIQVEFEVPKSFEFAPNGSSTLTSLYTHSGKYALKFEPHAQKEYAVLLNESCTEENPNSTLSTCEDCLPLLTPYSGKDYAIAMWTASEESIATGIRPSGLTVQVSYLNAEGKILKNQALTPKGPVIEGWQQIEEQLEIPANAEALKISIENTSDKSVFMDDFRFHPWLANMQSYVYDPYSMRLMAQLDENNYASFYEYNDEGILIRTKRETERGIVTIQEGRTILKPTN